MILKNIRYLIIATLCLHLGGCASSLNPRKQNVTILSTKDSEVFVDDNKIGKGKTLKAKIPRDIRVHQVKIETKGYLPEYDVIYQTKKSPLKILSFVPFGVLLYPMLMDFGPKAYNL
jgi:serine protease Do